MSRLLDRALRGEPLADLDVVDIHGHLGRAPFGVPDASAEALVAAMDRVGVRTTVCSPMMCLSAGADGGNDELLRATRAHPGRVLGYVRLWPSSPEEVRAEAERYLAEDGFVGVKLHNVTGFPYTHAAYAPALELADARRLPVLLHTWGRDDELAEVRTLAARYPGATWILGHAGVNRTEARYGELVREFGNVCVDLCMSLTPPGHVERMVEAAGADRVVWGSDAVFLSLTHQVGKVLGARLPDDVKVRLLSTNARTILGRARAGT